MLEIRVVVKHLRCQVHNVRCAQYVNKVWVHSGKNISVGLLAIGCTVRDNTNNVIKGYPNLTDTLDDGLTERAVVACVVLLLHVSHLHHTDKEGLASNASNDVQDTVVTHVSSFVSSYTNVVVTKEAFSVLKNEIRIAWGRRYLR